MQSPEIPINKAIAEHSDRFIVTYCPNTDPSMSTVTVYEKFGNTDTRTKDYYRELRELLNRLPLDD